MKFAKWIHPHITGSCRTVTASQDGMELRESSWCRLVKAWSPSLPQAQCWYLSASPCCVNHTQQKGKQSQGGRIELPLASAVSPFICTLS